MPEELEIPNLGENQPPAELTQEQVNPFLNGVDEADREIVAKYINNWDADVTKRFQEVHEQYKPYKELGADLPTIQTALQTMMWADQNPLEFYNAVKSQLEELGLMENETQPPVGSSNPLPEYEGLPDGFVKKFQGVEQTLGKINDFVDSFQKEQERNSNRQMLDKTLKDLENKHGKFDEDAVLGRIISKEMTPEEAVLDYLKVIKDLNSPKRETPPPTMGGGRTAMEQVDGNKIKDPKSRKQLVAELLSNRER